MEPILNTEEHCNEKQEDTLYNHSDGGSRTVVYLLREGRTLQHAASGQGSGNRYHRLEREEYGSGYPVKLYAPGGNGRTKRERNHPHVQGLAAPGGYELTAYNSPEHINVSGNTATVAMNKTGFAEPMPGYLFTAHQSISVMADDTLKVTVPVKQLVRLLNVELSVTEDDYSRALTVSILFTNGDTKRIESDVTSMLARFNDQTEPIKLTGNLLLPVKAGVTDATITGWNETDGGNADAN